MTDAPDSANDVRLHAIVHGEVQGVGFRAATQRRAVDLGLTGWVCNRLDGTVETVAEGSPASIAAFALFLQHGPRAALVDRVDQTIEAATGEFRSFAIRY